MIILYHGSNVRIEEIDLNRCHPYKDFGKGFYLTDIEEQARQMAVRRTRIAGEGSPIVTAYAFDERLLDDASLRVKRFDKPSEEWALFILENRQGLARECYDIVIGPITLDTLVKELTYRKLNRQYFFGTELSISKLRAL